jgi:hypothetical protein
LEGTARVLGILSNSPKMLKFSAALYCSDKPIMEEITGIDSPTAFSEGNRSLAFNT